MALPTQLDMYTRKERQMRKVDALYDMITDPKATRMRRVIAGLAHYTRRRYELEFKDPMSNQFANDIEWQFNFCAQEDASYQVRMVRLQLLFTQLVTDGHVRAYFCEPGATDHTLDPDKTLIDPMAFDTWIRDYMLAYTNDLFDGTRMDLAKYTQNAVAMYVALLRNSPHNHPRARALKKKKRTTTRP